MSENRFSDCDTVQSVLWKFASRAYQSTPNEATTDALARIAELSPPKDENLRDHAEHILRVHGLLNPTPRTVDAAGRERAREVTYDWWLNTTGMSRANADQLVDRIIDALGWTAAEPETCGNCDGVKCMACRSREHHDDCVHDCPVCCIPHGVGCGCWSCLTRAGIKLTEPTPAPVPPAPVVELDARAKVTDLNVDDLETLRDRLNEWPPIASGLGISERHAIPTDIGWIVHDGRAWVLRIGGTDE